MLNSQYEKLLRNSIIAQEITALDRQNKAELDNKIWKESRENERIGLERIMQNHCCKHCIPYPPPIEYVYRGLADLNRYFFEAKSTFKANMSSIG